MRIDSQNLFTLITGQAITASAASLNLMDLGVSNQRPGRGEPLFVVAQVLEAFTDAGSDSTVAVTLETDDNEAFSSPTTAVLTLGTFAALSAVGTRFTVPIPPNVIIERYLRAFFTVANGNLTTGKVAVFLVRDLDDYSAFVDASTIS